MGKNGNSEINVIEEVSSYISRNGEAEIPGRGGRKAKHHILDTLAACVSGSNLKLAGWR